jgi:serine protease Do
MVRQNGHIIAILPLPHGYRSPDMSHVTRRHLGALAAAGLLVPHIAHARSGPDSFAPLVKRVLPAVVNISVTETVNGSDPLEAMPPEVQRQFRDRFRRRRQQLQGAGSGFIVDPSGYIVTNNHVVGQADSIVVALSDGTELTAKLIGTDDLVDIAVIKVSAPKPLPFVGWGDSREVEVGDWVIAVGNPFGLGGSITAGIISARGRDIGASAFDDFLQIDAPINPGNSGGPVFNTDGQVVGVNTAIVSPNGGGSVGIGFAVPSELASRIAAELREKGRIERGWLGVSVQDLPGPDVGRKRLPGVAIAGVDRAGPAARAGIRMGDIVVAVNGVPVDSARGLIRAVAASMPGNSVSVSLRRQGHDMDLSVTVGRRPANDQG